MCIIYSAQFISFYACIYMNFWFLGSFVVVIIILFACLFILFTTSMGHRQIQPGQPCLCLLCSLIFQVCGSWVLIWSLSHLLLYFVHFSYHDSGCITFSGTVHFAIRCIRPTVSVLALLDGSIMSILFPSVISNICICVPAVYWWNAQSGSNGLTSLKVSCKHPVPIFIYTQKYFSVVVGVLHICFKLHIINLQFYVPLMISGHY